MNREEVLHDIEETLGLVPTFLKGFPDETLEHDWKAFKAIQLEEHVIPAKYKELIGLGISAVSKCKFCTLYHTEVAKMHGATDEEIYEAVRYAGNNTLWSAWLNGTQQDLDVFRDEMRRIGEHMKSKTEHVAKREVVSM
jgi:AhpD family alkylhydroperoxidase